MSLDAVSAYGIDFSAMRARFEQADADKSGALSLEEFEQASSGGPLGAAGSAGHANAEEMFASLDTDGDGEVTSTEAVSAFSGNFSSDAFMSLLAAQESATASGVDTSAARSQLTAAYGSQEDSENDLLGDLLDSLDDDGDEEDTA